MTGKFRTLFAETPFRLSLMLWSCGFLLVELSTALQGRTTLGTMLLPNLPLLALGVTLSLTIDWAYRALGGRHAIAKWPLITLAILAAGAVQTLADTLLLWTMAVTIFPNWRDWATNVDARGLSIVYILYTWTLTLSLGLILASRSNDAAKLNEARAAAFEAAATKAEAAALRLQLNPHFLFNTLNGIASLVVRKRVEEAEDMIGRLADFLRSSLAADPTALIPLRNELATIRAYLHIEQARLGDRLRLITAVNDDALDVPVPNFLLQPVIENAVKHGVAPYRRGGTIRLSVMRADGSLVISVVNLQAERTVRESQTQKDAALRARAGIGLINTRQRLYTLYGDQAWVIANPREDGYSCEIGLPLPPLTPPAVAAE